VPAKPTKPALSHPIARCIAVAYCAACCGVICPLVSFSLDSKRHPFGMDPNGFGPENQIELANVCRKLSDREFSVLSSNSDTAFIRALYSDFSIKDVNVQRAINSKGSKRAGHKEMLISNYS
jgi:site-specific DNA-adenine methylase